MKHRTKALELVDYEIVSAEDMLVMALKYMSDSEVEDMLDSNELSPRFFECEYGDFERSYDDELEAW